PDDAETAAGVRGDWLRREEVHHPLVTAPAEAQRDRVRQVQLVAAASYGPVALLVGKHGKVVAVRSLGAHDLIVQDVTANLDVVVGHHGTCRVAEQTRMDP